LSVFICMTHTDSGPAFLLV